MSSLSTTLSSRYFADLGGIKPWPIIAKSYGFLFANWMALFGAVSLPAALMSITLLLTFKTYFLCLYSYLSSPSVRVASIAVSIVLVGVILCALSGAVASAKVARVVQRQQRSSDQQLKGMEARVFAAALRLLAVSGTGLILIVAIAVFAEEYLGPALVSYVAWLGWGAAFVVIVLLSVRCGFLVPALGAFERRSVLRRGWTLSGRQFWQMTAIWLALAVFPAALLQALGELLIACFVDTSVATLAQGAEKLATNNLSLLVIAVSLANAVVIGIVLGTIGSCVLFQRLSEPA